MSTTPFLPSQISNCIIWFDATDTRTIRTSGSQVVQWNNKGTLNVSASNIPVSPYTIANSPGTVTTGNLFTGGTSNVFLFPQTSGFNAAYLGVSNVVTTQKSRCSAYIFSIQNSNADAYFRVFSSSDKVTATKQNNVNSWIRDGSFIANWPIGYADNENLAMAGAFGYDTSITYGTPFIMVWRHSTTLANNYFSVNGNQVTATGVGGLTANQALVNGYFTGTDNFIVGVGAGYSSSLLLGEVIQYDGEITTAQLNQLEGYLAWKWGRTAQLPANHPFKNSAPTGPAVQNITQLNLINTILNPGILQLPSSFTVPGRMLTFKDQTGAFSTNTLTITTNNANQTLDTAATSTINNTALGWQNFIAGNNNKWYTIGGTLINTVNTSTMNAFNMSTANISTANIFVSTMGFRDQTLDSSYTLSVQSSLLYYNYAGISTVLAGTRQSFGDTFLRMGRPFSPQQISGLQLWLDAADVNTFRGGPVWVDKSGTNNNAIPGSSRIPSIVTMNGQNAASFLIANSSGVQSTNVIPAFSVTYFIVLRSTGGVAGQNFIFINNVNGQRQMEVRFSGTNTYPAELRYTTNSPAGSPIIANINQNQVLLVCLTVSSGAGNLSSAFFNGSITANQTQTLFDTTTPNTINFIGVATDATRYLSGDIGEVLIYNQDFATISGAPTQRQQVEGYLAWKWGLVGNLPNNHPYKNTPP